MEKDLRVEVASFLVCPTMMYLACCREEVVLGKHIWGTPQLLPWEM